MSIPSGTTARFVVGSYSEPYGPFRAVGEGLSLIALDASGRLHMLDRLALPNPAFALPIRRNLVATVLETDDDRAGVSLVEIDGNGLRLIQSIDVPGRIPCHFDQHPTGRWLAGTCYGTGEVFTVPLSDDGRLLGEKLVATRHEGKSAHPVRQTMAHPHATRFSPDGRWLVVPDLGTDQVTCYRFDVAAGPDFSAAKVWQAPPGSGPRLPLFSGDGQFMVLVEEIGSSLVSLSWQDGALGEICRVSSRIEPFGGENTAAGLRWHPSGRVVGVSNRGADTIGLFYFDPDSGHLTPWREIHCGGNKPRDFAFSPCGQWIITTSQNSDVLAVFSIDIEAEHVRDNDERLAIRSPSCIRALDSRPVPDRST